MKLNIDIANYATTDSLGPAAMQHVRKEYRRARMLEEALPTHPFALFADWLAQAIDAGLHEPNAMTLATTDAQGRPSARMVLPKGFDERGFCFYTNYTSGKGRELEQNPWARSISGGAVRAASPHRSAGIQA